MTKRPNINSKAMVSDTQKSPIATARLAEGGGQRRMTAQI